MSDHVREDSQTFRVARFPSGRSRFVAASFKDVDDAMKATRRLEEHGYEPTQISVFMSESTRYGYLESNPDLVTDECEVVVNHVELKKETRALEGAGAGGLIGGAVGAVGAAIAAVGTALLIPPLGVAVAGPIAAAFAGAGAGAAAGGLVGGLVGAGMSEYRARRFEKAVKDGHVVVGVTARTEAERADLIERLDHAGGKVIIEEETLT
jgi:hypothetical protein